MIDLTEDEVLALATWLRASTRNPLLPDSAARPEPVALIHAVAKIDTAAVDLLMEDQARRRGLI